MGENTLALMEYFVTEAPLETFKKGNDLIFFDFLGNFFPIGFILIHYPWWFAVIIHYAAIAWAGYVIFHPLVRAMVVPKRKIMPILSGLWERFLSVMSVGISVTSAIMGTLFVAMIMNGALNKAMTYFAQEWYTLVLYGPAALAGMVFSEIGSRNFFRRRGLSIEITVSYGERRTYIGLIGVLAFLLYIMTSARIGSAFIVFIMLTSMLLGLAVDSILQPLPSKSTTTAAASSSAGAGKKRAAMSPVPITDKRAIHPAAYFVASTLPCIILTEVSWGLLDLLVPLTGRLGAQTAVDAIVSVVVGVLVAFHFALFIPLSHRLADDRLQQCFEIFLALTVTVVIFFCTAMFPFDEMHPKRVYVQYMENATSGQRAINIGIADPGPLSPVLDAVEKHLGVKPVKRTPLDVMQDWNIFFPFSRYMESYQFDITSKLPVTTENNAPILTIKEIEDENAGDGSKRKTREVLIQCYHPQHISTCVMLDGIQIIDWSLDAEVPEDLKYKKIQDVKPTSSNKPRRLYVRHAGGYISNTWNMTLTVPASNKFWVEVSGIERDSYHQLVQPSASDGASPKLGRSWAWSDRWETSRILGGVADAMPDWVTAYYASTDLMAVAQS
ncbi:hypothetical protein HK102_000694 [Quaeritorhiza haematococci]|nr:hypothetical protein HK102_000694 [Quaeritorhiza haematococci]